MRTRTQVIEIYVNERLIGAIGIVKNRTMVVAEWERQNLIFKEAVKITITPLLSTLSILNYLDIDSEAEMLGYGIGVILLNIGMYFISPAFVIIRLKQHKR